MPTVVDVDQLLDRLTDRTTGTAAGRIPGMARAAEHIVLDVAASAAATPKGAYPASTVQPPGYVAALDAHIATRTALLLGRLNLIVAGTIAGLPMLPSFESLPTAGKQAGQKKAVYSRAFTIAPDATATLIDASAVLNVSVQLDSVTAPIADRLLRLAVVAEAESQMIKAIEAKTVTPPADLGAALATFTGPLWSPSLVVVPPGKLIGLAPTQSSPSKLPASPSPSYPLPPASPSWTR